MNNARQTVAGSAWKEVEQDEGASDPVSWWHAFCAQQTNTMKPVSITLPTPTGFASGVYLNTGASISDYL